MPLSQSRFHQLSRLLLVQSRSIQIVWTRTQHLTFLLKWLIRIFPTSQLNRTPFKTLQVRRLWSQLLTLNLNPIKSRASKITRSSLNLSFTWREPTINCSSDSIARFKTSLLLHSVLLLFPLDHPTGKFPNQRNTRCRLRTRASNRIFCKLRRAQSLSGNSAQMRLRTTETLSTTKDLAPTS